MYDQLGAGLYPLGVRYDDSEGKVVATVEQDDVKQILKTFHEWYNEGIINSGCAATRPEDANYKACSIAQGWSGAAPIGVRSSALSALPRSGVRPSFPMKLSAAL